MGATVGLAIAGAVLGPKLAEMVGLGPKQASPNLVVEQPPAPAGAVQPEGAARQQQKQAAAAMGRSDTIATGPQGLGQIGAENTAPKTLLGY